MVLLIALIKFLANDPDFLHRVSQGGIFLMSGKMLNFVLDGLRV